MILNGHQFAFFADGHPPKTTSKPCNPVSQTIFLGYIPKEVMKMVYVLLAEGFEEIEAISVIDILRRGGVEVVTVSIGNSLFVHGAHHIKVEADTLIKEIELDDGVKAVVLPGGMPGTTHLDESKDVDRLLHEAVKKELLVAAVCAAPLVLGKRGFLKGKRATCYPGFEDHLKGAVLSENRVEHDGRFITSRGAGTAAYFAFEILKVLKNEAIAEKVRTSMIYGE